MSKTLVAYFTISGNTEKVAEKIAAATDGDLFKIEPVVPYTAADLNWRDKNSRTTEEKDHPEIRPEIKDKVTDMAQYSVIYIGFPIYWYTCPNIIKTFLESYGLDNRYIVPFATSGGSKIDKADKEIKSIVPKSATVLPGRVLNGNPSQETINDWVSSLKTY